MRLPTRGRKFAPQQVRSILCDDDLRFEIKAGRKSEILMIRPCEAIDAAMLASSIWVDTHVETDIGAVVICDDASRLVLQECRVRRRILGLIPIRTFVRS